VQNTKILGFTWFYFRFSLWQISIKKNWFSCL